ncbi:hypothetical protein JOD97_002161 [Duganella sp. 1411]|uniref:hypothetical protein n=1 Tax=Duganella sp. 1411 TaxID=2806572 RepID=UPI001AE636A4|nr:hypothetical protein [Duganella sp. 1411]MBP1204147.1 hypothetical protein [Duganella sp. 1411]
MQKIDFAALSQLAQASSAVSMPCGCNTVSMAAWQALPMTLELDRFEDVGTLMEDPYDEPTFVEFHPNGTRYESADAPISPRYFPYNRCTVARCMSCGRHYLRYNEAGGYFTELRIRALQPALLVDAAAV